MGRFEVAEFACEEERGLSGPIAVVDLVKGEMELFGDVEAGEAEDAAVDYGECWIVVWEVAGGGEE